MNASLSRDRVIALIQAYGAEPGRWPIEERSAALACIAGDPALAAELAQARELDSWLDLLDAPAPSPALLTRVLALAEAGRKRDALAALIEWLFPSRVARPTWIWRPALAVLLPLALGFLGGITSVATSSTSEWDSWEEEIYITGIVSVEPGMELLGTEADQATETPQ